MTHERVRELLPEALPDGDRLIAELALPLLQNGENPWPKQQRTA